ncbi:MAG: hypothetical protein JWR44_2857 [Hymenobacter sp.]|nr:hypothetical protein [Hymenobacter sp.]
MHKPLLATRLSRWLALVLLVLLSSATAWSQSTASYAFTNSSTGSLVDMSSGTTDALATGTYRDDDASAVQSLGFTFVFMGTGYTQFSVNSNGQLRLGSTTIAGTQASPASGAAILAPLNGDNAIQATGKVHYKVLPGTNRTLVVEWNSLRIPFNSTVGTGSVVQLLLEENTGKVEYRYGAVYNNSTGITRSIYISAGTSAGQIGVVKTFTTTPTYDATVTTATTTALPDNAVVTGLNSTADGARTVFTFTPPTTAPAAPGITFTNVAQTTLTVNITDNSTNEYTYSIYRSTDNVAFTLVSTLASTTTAATGAVLALSQSGLTANTTYYYQVAANSTGVSTSATATVTTPVAVPICGTKSVGPGAGADYATLTSAFTAVTNNGLCGPLVLELQAAYVSTTETFPLVYNYTGATATNTVTVRPAAGATGLSITGTATGAVFSIVGGKYLIIDGRPGGSGTTVSGAAATTDMTIASTSTTGIPLQFTSDATFNTVQHCQIKGVGVSDFGNPNVNFTGTVTTTGNSDNVVQYNNIGDGATTPTTLIYSGNTLNARNTISNNNLFNFYNASGAAYGIELNQGAAGWVITGNSIYQTASRAAVAATNYAIYLNSGNGHTVSNNFIGGTAASAGGTPWTVTGTAVAYRFVGIYLSTSGATTSVQGNTVANFSWLSSSGATTANGIWSGIYVSSGSADIGTTTGNTIGTVAGPVSVSTSTTGGYSFGISSGASGTVNIVGNTISNLTGVGSAATIASNVAGILSSTGSPTISRNKVYNLASGSGAANLSTGIWLTGGTTNTVTNNLIGDLRSATSTSLVAVSGILVAGGTTNNVYYNTINLAATSTGATFGTSGIYLNSTSAILDLRNNIVVNKSTAVGTGGYTAALRRVSGTAGTAPANLASTTNNNLYYAGTPSATNLIYVEGTTTATNAQQTIAAYKAFVAPRESSSVTEDAPFLSTTGTDATFLHISPTIPTQIEGGGVAISTVTIDFDGTTRGTTPDIGADEGTFTPQDLSGPIIAYTPLATATTTANRTLVVTITDPSGIGTGANAPRLYYRKSTSSTYAFVTPTSVSGNDYTFTFDFAAIGGVTGLDLIQYYVAAQDNAPAQNVSSSPVGATGNNPPGTAFTGTPNQFFIQGVLSGTYYVGTSTSPVPARTYASLTTAASLYNNNNLGGAVTFVLLDAAYSATTGETFPVIIGSNPDASATNTLTIKPNTGVTSTISGSNATAILALNGADYVTLDGSNGGTISATDLRPSRNITVTNTNASATSFVVLVTVPSTTNNATNNTVKNLNAVGSGSQATQVGIAFLSATAGTGGNNNNVVQNNTVQATQYGIYSFGVSATVKNTGTVITQNDLNATGANGLGRVGIVVGFEDGIQITRNTVDGIVFTGIGDIAGISAGFGLAISTSTFTGSEVTNATITRNNIGVVRQTGTYSAVGIGLAAATSGTSIIANNFVSGVASNGTSGDFGAGIFIGGGTGSTTRILHNSVSMTNPATALTGGGYPNFALAIGGSSPTVEIRNNALLNTQTTGTGNSVALGFAYAGTAGNYAGLTSSNNVFFVSTGAQFSVGQTGSLSTSGVLRTTVAALNAETGQDAPATSRFANPQFVSASDLHTSSVDLNDLGTPVAGVTVDFDGETRSTTTPDIGADEFTLPQTPDLAAVALMGPVAGNTCFSATEPVIVTIRTVGGAAINFATNPATVTVMVTPPTGPTQTFTTTIATGTLAIGATQNVTLPGTLDMTAPGVYSFAVSATTTGEANTTNDVLTPVPTRTVVAPAAGTLAANTGSLCVSGTANLALTGSANGGIQLQQSTDNVTFTDITSATGTTYTTPVLTQTTYYRARTTCNATVATSNVVTVTVTNPQVTSTNSPVTICAGSTATLTANASTGNTVRFFETATSSTVLASTATATGATFTTPALTTSRQYFVEAASGGTELVGRPAPASTTNTTAASYGLVFTASTPFVLNSVDVYPTSTAGNLVVQVQDNTGTLIPGLTATVAIPAGNSTAPTPFVVPLNFNIPAGTGLRLIAVSSPSLVREASIGGFPYTSPSGNVSITNGYISGTSTTYYFFYNWQVSTICAGTRTALQVNVDATPTATLPATTASSCSTSAFQLAGTVGGSATGGTYTSSGTGTFSPNASTLNATYTPSAADLTAGSVTLTLTTAGGSCAAATSQVVVTFTTPAVATFSYGTGTPTFCVSGTTNPAVALATGATAGTFSSTTGLTINATTGAITLLTSTPGTYTVTNTVAANGGCGPVTATAQVTITAAPTATFSYANAAGCVGSTTATTPTVATGATAGTFSSTTGLTINATTGAITLATSTAGTYIVTNTVAASNGCAAATATFTFTVNPRPATPTLTAAYNGSTTTLTSSSATGNQFYLGGTAITGATNQTYVVNGTPAQLGSYTVTTTNANGCVSLPSTALVVTTTKNGIAGASLRVYPNPTPTGEVTLELTGYRLATQLTVLDPLGRLVTSELLPAAAGSATRTLNLTGVATGVYLLRLSNADGVETRRLVRE